MSGHFEHTTVAGERWDLIAWRYYGAVHFQREIIAANRDLFRGPDGRVGPIPMRLPGGLVVRVPVIEIAVDEANLPPWKRGQPAEGRA